VAHKNHVLEEYRVPARDVEEEIRKKVRQARRRLCRIIEEMVELLDRIDGDTDLEPEEDAGVEDERHDEMDEGDLEATYD